MIFTEVDDLLKALEKLQRERERTYGKRYGVEE